MKLQLNVPDDIRLFTAHGSGYVMINGERHEKSIVVLAREVRDDWDVPSFESLCEAHFDYFLTIKPDVLLIGTGARQCFAHPRLYRALIGTGIAVEFMDTPAACRTYNILVAEDRKVVAAVLP